MNLKNKNNTIMETNNDYKLVPGFGNSFSTGWRVMSDIVTTPMRMFNFKFNLSDFQGLPFIFGDDMEENMKHLFTLSSLGIFAAFFVLLAMLYAFLVAPIFEYGGSMIFVQAVRKIKPDFELLIAGFMKNYLHIILANLLVFALVIMGCFALIIPGIIIGCRLVFVSYIIMDKKIDPIEAVEMSWRLTRGHGWTIFFMGFISIFIIIFGLLLIIVGIFPAFVWVSSSFASLYESVLREKEPQPEVLAA
jgi:hypothetical protein